MDSRCNDTPAEELAMILKAKAGDEAAKVWLLKLYKPLILRDAKRLQCHGVEFNDRVQMMTLSFLHVINKYDETLPVKFSTFVCFAVFRHAIAQAMSYERHKKLKQAEDFDLRPSSNRSTIEQRQARTIVTNLLKKLPPQEAIALQGHLDGKSLWQIADELNVTKQRAGQVKDEALARAKRWIENRLGILE